MAGVIPPGRMPASALDKDLLQLSQPLLKVQAGAGSEKFGGDGKMIDYDVADFFLKRMLFQMNVTAEAFSDKDDPLRKELNYRPIICSMIPMFTFLSPRFGQLLDGEDEESDGMEYDRQSVDSMQDDNSVGDFSMWSSEIAAQVGEDIHQVSGAATDDEEEEEEEEEDEENEGEEGGSGEEDEEGQQDNESVTSGLDLSGSFATHEDNTGLKRGEAVDFGIYGFDHSLGQRITLGVMDAKGVDSWPDYAFQIFYYGCAGACRNIRAGRMKKVPCIAIGIGWWASAEIDPVGFVQVTASNNRVSKSSVREFKSHVTKKCQLLESQGYAVDARNLQVEYLEKTDEELVAVFTTRVRDKTREAATNLNEKSFQEIESVYSPTFKKSANLMVGTATFSARSSAMLRYPLLSNARATQDDKNFISGMARMMYGDRVLKWDLNAVKKHSHDRHQAQRVFVRSIVA